MCVAAVNLIDLEHGVRFCGNFFVCDLFGVTIAMANRDEEKLLFTDINISKNAYSRQRREFLRGCRTDAHGGSSSASQLVGIKNAFWTHHSMPFAVMQPSGFQWGD